ncbi:autotransporter outer membrane beta-barrel domain-containing protein [Shewanella aestuarii]|uniref:Autotransporter outer membrane beta-barrel domain-containing protein n=1 Tax=Shewanella aestuarii TaxID=1028752 RepID=A0A6G9QQM9_9GAMM|nr:autotransporter outer membrane beta-barrel domain-containing protein [Shewanella aestuarii]
MPFAHSKNVSYTSIAIVASIISLAALSSTANAASRSPFELNVARTSTESVTVGDNGNELQRDVWSAKLSAAMPLNKQWMIGANIGYDNLDYGWRIKQDSAIRNANVPWSSINQYSAGLSLIYRPGNQWTFMFAPKIQYAYADIASSSNAQSYGAVASGMYRFESGNMLGVGVAYLNDISEVRTVPYLAVRWQISDKWVLANPFQAGFSGPAGLEVSYKLSDEWDFGVGSSRRTQRFLIENDDTTIEIEEWVGFFRAGWQISQSVSLNAYAGYFFGSEIELSEPKSTEDISNQAAGGLTFKINF